MGDERDGSADRSLDALLGEIARSPDVTPAGSLVGTTLGRYRIDALLGRGGMGVVYRAFDSKLSRDVALKVLPSDVFADSERRARFLKEARFAAAVTHPCTAAVYDVDQEGETIFLAMELVKGRTVRQLITENPSGMAPIEVARLGADVARGIAKAHDAGIVHRDLKPENVMVDDEGQVKVLDFGLAKLREVEGTEPASMSTELGRLMGTPAYMSPEQAKGKRVGASSDLFSLGIVLYEMLTSKRPFVGETTMEMLIAIDRDPPPPLEGLRTDLPRAMVAAVEQCLEKDPAARWPTARALSEALRTIAGSGSVSRAAEVTPSSRSRAVRWAVIPMALAALGAVVMLARRPATTSTSDAAPSSKAPLGAADAILACPVLEATGVEAPAGWLGAATASLACRRAVWMLDGRVARTLAPAELLDLPRAPSDELPPDVYGEPLARERSVTAARARAAAWLDGSVERRSEGFVVRLSLRTPDGVEHGHGEGQGVALLQALAAAMDLLGLPRERMDPEVAKWRGIADPSLALAVEDWNVGGTLGVNDNFEFLERNKSAIGSEWQAIREHDARLRGELVAAEPAPAIDRSSPAAFAHSAASRVAATKDIEPTVADELHVLLGKETSLLGRCALAEAEAAVRYASGDPEGPGDIMLRMSSENARSPATWETLAVHNYGRPAMNASGKAYAAWVPEQPDAWNMIGYTIDAADTEGGVRFLRRAFELSELPLFAQNYGRELLWRGRRADARAVAGRLLRGGPHQRRAGEALLVRIEGSELRFQSALSRGRALYASAPAIGSVDAGIDIAIMTLLDIAELTGGGTELADLLVERYVLAEPNRLVSGHFAAVAAAVMCPRARRDLARRCVERVRQLVDGGYFREGLATPTKPMLVGLEHWIKGDTKAAAAAWRPLIVNGATAYSALPFVVDAFDRAGDLEAADKADGPMLLGFGYNGASLAHLRSARRAAKRGDSKRARELAQQVIDAWSAADMPIDAVREMRELLAKLHAP